MVSGVSRVQVFGGQKFAVRVQLNPDELAARGVGFDEVMQAIQRSNVNLPTGRLYGEKQAFTVQSSGELTRAAAYRPIIVSYKNGVPIRLEQLGNVIDGFENDKTVAWFNGVKSMMLAVQRQPGTNTVEVVKSIRALLPQFRSELPPSIKLEIGGDAAESIQGFD
jgi:HAE1 family hydrophobic/amphiphilic exporter-1